MHTAQLAGQLGPFVDPATGQQVPAHVQGTFTFFVQGDPNQYTQHLQGALLAATNQVVSQKLAQNQIALPTLAHSLPHFIPEIVAASGAAQMGVQIQSLQLQAQVQQPQQQFYQGQMPPDPHTQMQNRMAEIAQERLDPRNYEVKATVNVGGYKLSASSDGGFDKDGLMKQVKDKAVSAAIWWIIGGVIVLLLLLFLAGLGWYMYSQYKAGEKKGDWQTGSAAPAEDAETKEWDGKSPLSCGAGDNLKIKGVKADLAKGPAINAGANCQLQLDDVDITAPIGIQAGGSAVVIVNGGSVNGKEAAAKALGKGKIVFKGTKVTGKTQKLGEAKIEGP